MRLDHSISQLVEECWTWLGSDQKELRGNKQLKLEEGKESGKIDEMTYSKLFTQDNKEQRQGKYWIGIRGQDNVKGRQFFQKDYFHQLLRSKIVVNINPDQWEGDYRLMEALASETLLISDTMYIPGSKKYPLVNNTHMLF